MLPCVSLRGTAFGSPRNGNRDRGWNASTVRTVRPCLRVRMVGRSRWSGSVNDVALPTLRGMSICSGVGGLDLGVKLAVANYRTVCYIEREAYAAAVIVARMEDSSLDQAPIWDDIYTFDGAKWRGSVDIVIAGFPCQPWSNAGARKGTQDERWIWPRIAEIIREVGPDYVFLENVAGLLTGGGVAEVLGSLAAIGFDAEWESALASDAGAPHRRERVFILGRRTDLDYTNDEGRHSAHGLESIERRPEASRSSEPCVSGRGSLAYTESRRPRPKKLQRQGDANRSNGNKMGNADIERLDGRWSRGTTRDELPAWPPGPEERDRWDNLLKGRPDVAPSLPKSEVRGMANGFTNRVDRVRALGNAVVPAQASLALRILLQRFKDRRQ